MLFSPFGGVGELLLGLARVKPASAQETSVVNRTNRSVSALPQTHPPHAPSK
jgi:hypothetical protein